MEESNIIKETIDLSWSIVNSIREKTSHFLNEYDQNFRKDTLMVVSELLENAVKYGEVTFETGKIEFEIRREGDCICIKVSNYVKNKEDLSIVTSNINQINASSNPMGLYLERLLELKNGNNPGKIQLGLYRIAYEGEYSLQYACQDGILAITAKRKIPEGGSLI